MPPGRARKLGQDMGGAAAQAAQLDREAQQLKDQLNPLGRAQREYNQTLAQAERLYRSGRITMGELTAAGIQARSGLERFSVAQNQAAGSSRNAAFMAQNLGFQIQDVTQQVALGVNPMTIFAQQGGQVAFALSGASGAVGRFATFLSGPLAQPFLAVSLSSARWHLLPKMRGQPLITRPTRWTTSRQATEALNEASAALRKSKEEEIRVSVNVTRQQLREAIATRELTKAKLEQAKAEFNRAENPLSRAGDSTSASSAIGAAGGAVRGLTAPNRRTKCRNR